MRIRRAGKEDLEAIYGIEASSFPRDPYTRGVLEYLMETCGDLFLVAEGEEVLGYCASRLEEGVGQIISLAIHPRYRGRGIGRLLTEDVIGKMEERGAKIIHLQVETTNAKAFNLYKELGFQVWRIIPDYYGRGLDAYHMVKRLKP